MSADELDAPTSWADLPRKRIGAGAILLDPSERVLLVNPTYKDGWETPGGMVEECEAPRTAAAREVREELGLDVRLGRLLICDWSPSGSLPDDALVMLYAADPINSEQIRLGTDELSEWRWCAEDEIDVLLSRSKARRVRAAIEAHRNGTFLELEHGHRVGPSGG